MRVKYAINWLSKASDNSVNWPGPKPFHTGPGPLGHAYCWALVYTAQACKYKLIVEVSIMYAAIARGFESHCRVCWMAYRKVLNHKNEGTVFRSSAYQSSLKACLLLLAAGKHVHTLMSIKTTRECVLHDNTLLLFMPQFITWSMAVTHKQAERRGNENK